MWYYRLSCKTTPRCRNVAVHDEGFEDIVVDRSTGNVVGIQVITSRGDVGRGIVLVDKNGNLRRDDDLTVTVQLTNTKANNVSSEQVDRGGGATARSPLFSEPTRQNNRRDRPTSVTSTATTTISDANNELLIQYGLIALGLLLALKIIFSALNVLAIFLVPVLYLYAAANCPTNNTFDAKKELKRVMRGAHLPAEQKPKGFFEQGLSRLAASVTTELATSLGYEVSLTDILGAAKLASVKVPVANAEFYWMGIFGEEHVTFFRDSISYFVAQFILLCLGSCRGKWREVEVYWSTRATYLAILMTE